MSNKLIIILVIILGTIAIAQMMRVSQISYKLRGKRPEETLESENRANANLMLVFMVLLHASLIYIILKYGFLQLGPAASVEGVMLDKLFVFQWTIVLVVYFACVTILFYFAWKYRRKPGVKAYYFPYEDRLEMAWTVIPAVGLSFMIIFGLKAWNYITSPAVGDYENVEIFSEQFKWTARYSGVDNELGKFDYKLTTDENPFGLVTRENIQKSLKLMEEGAVGYEGIASIEAKLNNPDLALSKSDRKKLEAELGRKERMARLLTAMNETYSDSLDQYTLNDIIVEDSLILLKGRQYYIHLRAKDVIHSAYFPHFRAQINTVPGLTTYLNIKPTISTKEMKEKLGNPDFEYALMCNKICGTSHYKMKMSVVVLDAEDYLAWQKTKQTVGGNPWISGDGQDYLEFYKLLNENASKKSKK